MSEDVRSQIESLQQMTVGELRARYEEVFGEPARSANRQWLLRRVAWRLPERYDDGGFSGGTTERPALRRLMADIDAGQIDAVLVYKVDRLSRSLLDFGRLMETFEARGVSFVSVTQEINTANSMGRLMLNVLLSFAQFEREIISERTRDKIAAARRKGKWAGGHQILGYDLVRGPGGTKLAVNEEEAQRVSAIFSIYAEHRSLQQTIAALDQLGWTTKAWETKAGRARGGQPFSKSSLHKLLTNVAYGGQVVYRDQVFEGEQPAIVDEDLFLRVQAALRQNGVSSGGATRNRSGALLKGLVRCRACGGGMSHSFTTKGSKMYRYYVCVRAQKQGWSACPCLLVARSPSSVTPEQLHSERAFGPRTPGSRPRGQTWCGPPRRAHGPRPAAGSIADSASPLRNLRGL
jgi:site-specific DNA recombinase